MCIPHNHQIFVYFLNRFEHLQENSKHISHEWGEKRISYKKKFTQILLFLYQTFQFQLTKSTING